MTGPFEMGFDERTDLIPVKGTVMAVFCRTKQVRQARVSDKVNAHDMIGRTGDIRVVTGRIVDEENRRSRASGELTYSLSLGTLIGDDGKPDTVGSQGVGAISALGMGYVRQDDNFHVPAQTLQRESGSGNHR